MQKTLNGFIPNGALINGVANFYTSTKPTIRVDGSALVIGDRWVNSSTGVEGFYNGTYWLSGLVMCCLSGTYSQEYSASEGFRGHVNLPSVANISQCLIESFSLATWAYPPYSYSNTNKYTIQLRLNQGIGFAFEVPNTIFDIYQESLVTTGLPLDYYTNRKTFAPNYVVNISERDATAVRSFQLNVTKFGTGGTSSLSASYSVGIRYIL